ncbi:MAG TPA: hypothetical protein VGI61_07635, partial [Parafilimonas sp.]
MRLSKINNGYLNPIQSTSKKQLFKFCISLVVIIAVVIATPLLAQDPTGANTGTINDVAAATAGKPTANEIGAQAGHN